MQEKNKFEQQKKEFQSTLSMFSHEIRNPLALITSELQMLSDHHPQLCLDEHWDNIMENLNYIRELLDELSRYQNAGHLSLVSTVRLFLIFSAMHRRPFSTHTEKSRLPLLLFQMEYRSPSMTMAVV